MPKEFSRKLRLNVQMQQVIAQRLRLMADPRFAGVTVTEADVAPDLRQAKIRVSVLGDDLALTAAVRALNRAAGKLRHEVGRALALRYLPQLHFEADTALRTGDRVGALIRQVRTEDASHARARGETGGDPAPE